MKLSFLSEGQNPQINWRVSNLDFSKQLASHHSTKLQGLQHGMHYGCDFHSLFKLGQLVSHHSFNCWELGGLGGNHYIGKLQVCGFAGKFSLELGGGAWGKNLKWQTQFIAVVVVACIAHMCLAKKFCLDLGVLGENALTN